MAFQMNYTTFKGANYPQSYWRLNTYQIDRSSLYARARFDCYFDNDARLANPESNVLESKNYTLQGDDFSAVFEGTGDVREAMYAYAKNCLEGEAPEGEPDTRVSFFATAIDI